MEAVVYNSIKTSCYKQLKSTCFKYRFDNLFVSAYSVFIQNILIALVLTKEEIHKLLLQQVKEGKKAAAAAGDFNMLIGRDKLKQAQLAAGSSSFGRLRRQGFLHRVETEQNRMDMCRTFLFATNKGDCSAQSSYATNRGSNTMVVFNNACGFSHRNLHS